MGLEQLAALKKQLQQKAEDVSKANKKLNEPVKKASAPDKKIDPVLLSLSKLQKRFPLTFPKKPDPKVPLKVGILEDLKQLLTELAMTEQEIIVALRVWCRSSRYRNCLTEGAARIDLSGQEVGCVTAKEANAVKKPETRLNHVHEMGAPKILEGDSQKD